MPEIGSERSRVDGQLKVRGAATYAADFVLPGMAFAVIVGSTVGKGRITGFETRDASGQPGVLQVLTHLNTPKLPYLPFRTPIDPQVGERLHVLQDDQVKFFGQPVAVVVAETLQAAEHAAGLVTVRYDTAEAVTDLDKPGLPLVTPTGGDYTRGDPVAALASAPVKVDGAYRIAREHHNPMELHATIAQWEGDKLTLWDKTQGVLSTANEITAVFGLPAGSVHVVSPFVGGAFGSALRAWPHVTLAALAARQTGRPVKLVLSRKQMYSGTGYRAANRQRFAVGADRDGRITVMVHESVTETSAYEQHTEAFSELARFLYTSPNVQTTYRLAELDVNTPTYMRGPGRAQAAFAIESGLDDLAYELAMDPIDLRLRNEPDRDQFNGLPFSTRRLRECYEIGAAKFGWSRRKPQVRTTKDGHWLVGVGTATACYHTIRNNAQALARVKVDGTVVVASATSDMGPGTYTAMCQVAADSLGIEVDKIQFLLGDSTLPPSPPHGGSQTMASVGSAVREACESLRDTVVRMAVTDPASPLYGLEPHQIQVRNGRLEASGKSDSYREVLRRRNRDAVEVTGQWGPGDTPRQFSSYAYGAVFAEVGVDETLGLVRIRRLLGVYDAGRVINPKLARSQGVGGLIGGIGMALLENTVTDHRDGRLVNASMADYLVPVNADVPAVDVLFLDGHDDKASPIGAKGLGEITIVGVAPAIANAVYHATGKRVRELPITLDKLL
ncbi:xanthine dehydrogenase family protein molybdopterin-binding subunit [Kibdelosporangium aridum]|uniref:xanthine dehydrogenase family protein molybdopterin-binding subunit n=1 Tax=Kibdelosporangium aridum TaxID=2030 RepID=UPI000523F758